MLSAMRPFWVAFQIVVGIIAAIIGVWVVVLAIAVWPQLLVPILAAGIGGGIATVLNLRRRSASHL